MCAFFLMYAVPTVVAERRNWLGSIYYSARLAIRWIGTSLIAAILIEAVAALSLSLGYLLAAVPYVGIVLQSALVQLCIGFFAVFTLEQPIAIQLRQGHQISLLPEGQ